MFKNTHRRPRWRELVCLTAVLFSCGPSLPELRDIDLAEWKKDKMGCAGVRAKQIDQLAGQRKSLLGLSEVQLIQLLGMPDENELYERNQKFYKYFLTSGPSCDVPDTNASFLTIRFNAVGRAQEVAVE